MAMNSRKKSLRKPVDKDSENPPLDHIKELERQVAALKKDVDTLKDLVVWPFSGDEDDSREEKRKPGPTEKVDDTDLFLRRDKLILWLEPIWPWLEGRLQGSAEDMKAAFEAVAENPEFRPDYQERMLQNTISLREFLLHERSGKHLRKATVLAALDLPLDTDSQKRAANQLPTRKIANAMAGVPELGWRRSLDRCSARPSRAFVAVNMDLHCRNLFGIPTRVDQDLTGAFCIVPKSLQPVLTQASGVQQTDNRPNLTTEPAAGEGENT
jgi:hypothetical protein